MKPGGVVPLAAGLVLIAAAASAQSVEGGIKNGEWPAYAGDLRNNHYSPLDQIDASNFNKLEIAWRFKTGSLGPHPEYKLEGTPLMVNGVVYTTAGSRRSVVALDAVTGELLWSTASMKARVAPPLPVSYRVVEYRTGRTDEATNGSCISRQVTAWFA